MKDAPTHPIRKRQLKSMHMEQMDTQLRTLQLEHNYNEGVDPEDEASENNDN